MGGPPPFHMRGPPPPQQGNWPPNQYPGNQFNNSSNFPPFYNPYHHNGPGNDGPPMNPNCPPFFDGYRGRGASSTMTGGGVVSRMAR